MSESISSFLASIKSDIARPNRFKVEFPNDDGIVGLLCYSCTLPQRAIQTFELKQRGVPYKVPFSQDYQPITFSFYANPTYNTRRFFEEWHKEVVQTFKMNVMGTYDVFAKKARIYTLDRTGRIRYRVNIFEAWPLNIGEVDLNYGTNNTYSTVTVTLTYKYWNANGVS